MLLKQKCMLLTSVCVLSTVLTGCGGFGGFRPSVQTQNNAISNTTIIPFQGDYQTAHDQVVRNARSCFSRSNQVVKALQLREGMSAQIDVFDRGNSPAEPLPADLRVKAFMEPSAGGGQIKIDTFSANGEYAHSKSIERFSSWLANQQRC
ncbi:MAG: hypothetical protein ACPGVN_01170 [Alphaproteobacteria bacterium]